MKLLCRLTLILGFIGAKIAFKAGRILTEFNCFRAKGMAGQKWILMTFVEAREFLWWLEALVFAYDKDALEPIV